MRVLVLGATGRLGRMLQWGWRDDPRLTPVWHGRRVQKAGDFKQFDMLGQGGDMQRAAQESDVILCLAGITPVSGDDMSLNTDLALAARRVASGRPLLVASSAAVYGRAGGLCRETDTVRPSAPYGAAKLAMERAVLAGAEPPVTCLRIGNVAGADQILGQVPAAAPLTLDRFADGSTPRRSYVGPETLSAMLARLCVIAGSGTALPAVLNLTSPGAVEMGALLDAASQDWAARPAPSQAIREVMLDTATLGGFITLDPDAGRADRLVAEWRAYRNRTENTP